MQPLDGHLNAAVTSIASRLYPHGFDVRDDAPDTFEKLKAQFATGRMSFGRADPIKPSTLIAT
jgi:hypothetical protein